MENQIKKQSSNLQEVAQTKLNQLLSPLIKMNWNKILNKTVLIARPLMSSSV